MKYSLGVMELPVRQRLPHEIPAWVPEASPFFITISCAPRGKNQLCLPDTGDAVLGAAARYHTQLIWHCELLLLMPDHLHAIIRFPRMPGLKNTVSNWKKYLARDKQVVWQRDFFDHRLRDHHEVREKQSYILMNPVRKRLCERAEDWNWVYQPKDRLPG